ncbi:MAG: 3-methyl-2-oxobutanoate hydroxymethyltransferase [Candidatus Liptonbacteria bacterium]|nr:3-methyl-2-oxobutanoate hydroxymethyltransferase [Candidatus Liptonbacteria bacterium]
MAQDTAIPEIGAGKVTIRTLQEMKKEGTIIAASSIYDEADARHFDRAGGDVIIVGDSVAMVKEGRTSTIPMRTKDMIPYAEAVRNGTNRLFVVGDMPFLSYELSNRDALLNAGKLIRGVRATNKVCNAVKIETNLDYVERIQFVSRAILVVAHIGLNPNKAELLGGYRTQGRTAASMETLLQTAEAVVKAGACMVLLESITEEVAQLVKDRIDKTAASLPEQPIVPVLGIAAGRKLDGQLMISGDIKGDYEWPGMKALPKHVKQYTTRKAGLTGAEATVDLFKQYVEDVREGRFPAEENVHHVSDKGALRDFFAGKEKVDSVS